MPDVGVARHKPWRRKRIYPDHIEVRVMKNGQPAPDNTVVHIANISGDAQLMDPSAHTIVDRVDLTTTNSETAATLVMRSDPRAMFTVRVPDPADATKDLARATPVLLSANGTCDDLHNADCRGSFEASFYLGEAIDSFAGDETIAYLNPDVTGPKQRAVGGFDFAYRMFGNRGNLADPKGRWRGTQLWVYGETVHGVRSK
ncbi:MAG: hypothetical protein M3Q69_17750 [Acidobacteriota bacterium]|nr:hypothetical protein [Acidobacteriota bacterium]